MEWEREGERGKNGLGGEKIQTERSEEREYGPNRHLHSKPGLPGCCQVTVTWCPEGMLTFVHFGLILKRRKKEATVKQVFVISSYFLLTLG